MDAFDVKILNILQTNARVTTEKLGDLVGLSATACQRRIKKMREDGVIAAEVAVLSPHAAGRRIIVVAHVTMEKEYAHVIDDFKTTMRKSPEVMQCYYVTGDADFILVLSVEDMSAYQAFTKRFFFDNKNIARFNTSVVLDPVKMTLAIPVSCQTD